MEEVVATKDVAIAALGGAAAIASVLLVFVTFMALKADSLPENTPDKTISRFTMMAKCGLIPLLAEVVVIAASYAWLFFPSNSFLFYLWSIGFPVALLLFVIYSAATTLQL